MLRREARDIPLRDGPAQHPLRGLVAVGVEHGVAAVEVERPRRPARRGASPASPAETSSNRRVECSARSASRAPAARIVPPAMITRSSHSRSTTSSWCEEKSTATPCGGALLQHAGDDVDGERVQARERLVEDQHLGVVHERGGDLRALLVAEREGLDVVAEALAESELLEQRGGAGRGIRSSRSRAGARGRRSARAPSSSGRARAPRACTRSGGDRMPSPRRRRASPLPASFGEHAQDDPHGRGLAGAVAADEAGEAAGRTSNDTSSSSRSGPP